MDFLFFVRLHQVTLIVKILFELDILKLISL